nr:MAG TPA: hyaluronidase [Caudoviricetes sp.]
MTGNLILNANPTANLGAATKQYVDSLIYHILCRCYYFRYNRWKFMMGKHVNLFHGKQ